MSFLKKNMNMMVMFILIPAAMSFSPGVARAGCDCNQDTADPPFLTAGADPNLLLMIDNSASMYDVAYKDGTKESWECFDDSYNAANSYAGYFDEATLYLYDSVDSRFEPTAAVPGAAAHGGTYYKGEGVVIEMWGSDAAGWEVELYATGNLLNWATTSKYDIEKDILTGGKYDGVQWISEGRGCAGYRFVKEVALVDTGGTAYRLTMGINADQDDGTAIEDETTVIDIFKISETGYDYGACRTAMDEVMYGTGNPQNAVRDCIDPMNEAGNPEKQVLIHSTTDCWKYWKGDLNNWPQHTTTLLEKCMNVYGSGKDPREITPSDSEYACYGIYDAVDPSGYLGRCWIPGTACTVVACADKPADDNKTIYQCNPDDGVEYCPKSKYKSGACTVDWTPLLDCPEGDPGALWLEGYDTTGPIPEALDDCVYDAMSAYCDATQVPQVVDPSDQQFSTGEVYNLPAILTDGGVEGQLSQPIARLNVLVKKADDAPGPSGLLQEFSSQIRIGAMAFHTLGSGSECLLTPEDNILYACETADNKDGAYVLQGIGSDSETAGHTDALVTAINDEKAGTWTPLAEAMYTAIGYYSQDAGMELNPGVDFTMWGTPITEWCQSNNVLFITDGASTADLHLDMITLGDNITPDVDIGDGDTDAGCGDLFGSTYFDDLAFHARQGDIYAGSPYTFEETPRNINSYVVYTGSGESGADQCPSLGLMESAVANGGPNATNDGETDEVYQGDSPEALSAALRVAFQNILKRAAAGSAASVISATRGGEGAVYQAIFWPGIDGPEYDGSKKPDVTWAGEVHALLVDGHGNLYEDTNGDKLLSDTDQRVIFFFDESSDPVETKACYGELNDTGGCTGVAKSLHEVNYLWSVAEWLAGIDDADIDSNRTTYISGERKRHMFTWNDLDNDGVVDAGTGLNTAEILSFEPATDWSAFIVSADRGDVAYDFGVNPGGADPADVDAEVDALVSWIRGKDAAGYRSREVTKPDNFNVTASVNGTITWRLGDVVHSTPTSVSRPAENYHMMYRDDTYIDFVNQYEDRRHVIYFGGNDGLIHAVNGGFYSDSANGFCKTADCTASATAPELGAELWAYAPYNLQPQLECLTDPDYLHRYYVDLKPRIFDVQIFTADADHPNGWGTILVAGMRFGGSSVDADAAGDYRKFVSAYTIFDITNPEEPPVLLGELTFDEDTCAHMGYTTLVPAVVPMKEGPVTKWYLVFGSGPLWLDAVDDWVSNIAITGVSNQQTKVAVFPLDELTTGGGVFRILDQAPTETASGRFVLPDVGFMSDPISVDYQLDKNYRADAVYFGTVEGIWGNWSGKLYRMVTNSESVMTGPDSWTAPGVMMDPGRPVTAAPMVGYDGENFWVYFGTGRFFSRWDKIDPSSNDQESYYGLKEPWNCSIGAFSWATLDVADLVSVGSIRVTEAAEMADAALGCDGGGTGCIPAGITNYEELVDYIAGTGCDETDQPTGEAGWILDFDMARERNLGQATLLGGLLTFTTYQPFDDVCRPEGEAYLYAVYYKTGAAWHEAVFSDALGAMGDPPQVVSELSIGRGLATTPNLHVGREEGAKAFAQTSTGAIVEIEQPNLPIKAAKTGRMSWRVD